MRPDEAEVGRGQPMNVQRDDACATGAIRGADANLLGNHRGN